MQQLFAAFLNHLTFLAVLLPVVGVLLTLASHALGPAVVRRTALTNVVLSILLVLLIVQQYEPFRLNNDFQPQTTQMVSHLSWFESPNSSVVSRTLDVNQSPMVESGRISVFFSVGMDGVSLWFVVLTPLLLVPAICIGPPEGRSATLFYSLLLLLEAFVTGMLTAQDVVTFYVCLEASMVPLFLLMGNWGGYGRSASAQKFFVYHLAGGLLILLALLTMVVSHQWVIAAIQPLDSEQTFSIVELTRGISDLYSETNVTHSAHLASVSFLNHVTPWVVCGLIIGFAIRAAAVPFHTWLSGTILESPSALNVVLGGIGLKVGIYGIVRFVVPLADPLPDVLLPICQTIAVTGAVYAGLLTLAQSDLRKLAAYACVSHTCLASASLFSLSHLGIAGGMLFAICQGACMGGLIYLIHLLARRFGTSEMLGISGLNQHYPRLSAFFLILLLASIGLPTFPPVIMMMTTLFASRVMIAGWSIVSFLLLAWTFLWTYQRLFAGTAREPRPPLGFAVSSKLEDLLDAVSNEMTSHADVVQPSIPETISFSQFRRTDLTWKECVTLVPLLCFVACVLFVPQFFVDRMTPSIDVLMGYDSTEDATKSPLRNQASIVVPDQDCIVRTSKFEKQE